jgi:hypothetical protein
MMKKWILAGMVGLIGVCALAEVTVTNLVVQQRPGTKLVDITYDMISDLSDGVHILLFIEDDGERIPVSSLSGDVGANVLPGTGRQIVWDAGRDWSAGQIGELVFILAVNDAEVPPAPVAKTGQTVSYREGDDGWHQAGVVWPNPRFTDNEDGTVTDHLTGLMWVKEPHALPGNTEDMSWESAIDFSNELNFANYSDWRLPNVRELRSLMNQGVVPYEWFNSDETPFNGIHGARYWTSTSYGTSSRWTVQSINGSVERPDGDQYVWSVRSINEDRSTLVAKTGQTISYRTGDDGDLQIGLTWPEPRFTEKGSGSVMDNLTGLEWVKQPHALPENADSMDWGGAIDFCTGLDHNGYTDWRLPGVDELLSLVDYGKVDLALPTEHPFSTFNGWYWSGTTRISSGIAGVRTFDGGSWRSVDSSYVWPVRGSAYSETPVLLSEQSASVDTSDYTLTVASERGHSVPIIGSHTYASGSAVTCSAPETVIEQGILWRCTGWTGTGSIPPSGTTNTTGDIVLTDLESSITWQWEQASRLSITNVIAQQRPGTKLVDITYDVISDLTNGVHILLFVEDDGQRLPVSSLSGDFGANVLPGTGRQIVWDAGRDWSADQTGELVFILAVNDTDIPPAPVAKTGQTVSYREGDDGWHQAGVVWPNPRFTDNEDGTVTDHLTGLMWVKEPHTLLGNSEAMEWENAIDFCNSLNFAGYADWRLPNIVEMQSLMRCGLGDWGNQPYEWLNSTETPFLEIQAGRYWSSTSLSTSAWNININGSIERISKSNLHFVWQVRSVASGGVINLPKTGQETSYISGDDGDINAGASWPDPRFVDKDDGTIRDSLTGLIWMKDPHNLYGNTGPMNWEEALILCNDLNFAGYTDWRLPSRNELLSINNYNRSSVLPTSSDGFYGLQTLYWCSSTAPGSDRSWRAVSAGAMLIRVKSESNYVWPVRGSAYSETPVLLSEQVASVDTVDYTLTVASERGHSVPIIGSHTYASGSAVTCSVPEMVIEQGIRWNCTGWTGTGSVPASGATNTTGDIVLTDLESSITWQWETNFSITNVVAQQRPGSKLVDITYDIVSDLTNGVPIALSIEQGGTSIPADNVSGDLGEDILPGSSKSILWDAGLDFAGEAAELVFTVGHQGEPGLTDADNAWVYAKDYTLTVNDGSGSGTYTYQQQVEITAEPPADWIGLDYWSGDTNHIDQLSAPVATVTIPSEDITVSAVFKNLYTVNPDDTVTITGYSGSGGVVFIPEEIEGRPVTSIANLAYFQNSTITHLTVPASVTHVGIRAFSECTSLEGLYFLGNAPTAGANVLADSPLVTVYYYPGSTGWAETFDGKPAVLLPYEYSMQDGSVTITAYVGNEDSIQIPELINGLPVTGLADWSFYGLEHATSVTVPATVTSIGEWAFGDSDALQRVSFRGDAPAYGSNPFFGNDTVRIYHPAGGQGWGDTFAGRPADLAGVGFKTAEAGFGMRPAGFGLPIRGELGMNVVIEFSTNLVLDGWTAIETNTITEEALEFIDPDATNRPSKYYRIREK